MKKTIATLFAVLSITSASVQAIDVDEIISSALENTGGIDNWKALKGFKMTGEFNQGGMKFPFVVVNLKDGRQYMEFSFQGKKIKQNVFDGETMWSTNFMTMQPEKADAEATANQKLDNNDFPTALANYKENGYTVELLGTETIDGTEAYKVKLVKEPLTLDGKEVANISFHYFDSEALVLLQSETEIRSGHGQGKMGQSKLGDYQEVGDLYFPFSMSQGIKGGPSASMEITKIELNPTVDASEFAMPKIEDTPASATP